MPPPPPPTAGQQWSYRAIGWALAHVTPAGRRQVRWEDQTTNHTDNPDVLALATGERFECVLVMTYTGTNPKDPFEQTGPVVTKVTPLPPLPPHDPVKSKELWDRIAARNPPPEPEPTDIDEDFWLQPKD